MKETQTTHCNELYQRHLKLLKLQGKANKTIEAYSLAIRRLSKHFNCCPEKLTPEQLLICPSCCVHAHVKQSYKV
jgi:integrase/recombinase XerD